VIAATKRAAISFTSSWRGFRPLLALVGMRAEVWYTCSMSSSPRARKSKRDSIAAAARDDAADVIAKFREVGLEIIPRGSDEATIRGRNWPGRQAFVRTHLEALKSNWAGILALKDAS